MQPMNNRGNLVACACHWEQATPNRTYLIQPMGGGDANIKTWTWQAAVSEARRMAAYLKSLDLPASSSIAICSKNCAHWIMADLAIWMAGHISVPIYPVLTADLVGYLLDHSEARLLFVGKLDPVWKQMHKGVPPALPTISFPLSPTDAACDQSWDEIVSQWPPLEETAACPHDQTATIIYTSGSTGTPKGAMISFEAMVRCAAGLCDSYRIDNDDRSLSYLPLAHVFERWSGEACSIYAGFQLFFAESVDTFLQDLQRARPTLFVSVPLLWLRFQQGVFQKMPPDKLDRLLKIPILRNLVKKKILRQLGLDQTRLAASGSSALPVETIEWYRNLGLELIEGYGMTENFAYSHGNRIGLVRPGYVGPPYADVQHRINADGEIEIKSPGNLQAYFKMPEETHKVFTEDGFIRTGDLGEIDDQNRLKITGRTKDLFKTSKGKYVAPVPIEQLIVNHPMVDACIVSGAGHAKPHGVVTLFEDARQAISRGERSTIEGQLANLLETVNGKLPAHEKLAFLAVGKDIWSPENGLLTPTMKLRRKVLEARYAGLADSWYGQEKPVVWEPLEAAPCQL